MADLTMGVAESKFADIIWQNEPITSTELWKKCESELGWKKSTTFTVLKRLCDKGIFKNDSGAVLSLISRDEFYSAQSQQFVDDAFNGSLPAFLAAFTKRKSLSAEEIKDLKRLIDEYEGE